MGRGSLIFSIILLLVVILLLGATFTYPLRSKLFPLIALSIALLLLVAQVVQEGLVLKGKDPAPMKEKKERRRPKFPAIWFWLAGTLPMLWLLGFMGTVILLPFLYLRWSKENWIVSITLPLGGGVFFYALFNLALGMPLYPGILYPRILG